MTVAVANDDNSIMQALAELYLQKDLTPLQKKIYDWWTGEGFFHVSDFKDTDTGTHAELVTLFGEGLKSIIASNAHSVKQKSTMCDKDMNKEWQVLPIQKDFYILEDTPYNRSKLQRLIGENIRYFTIDSYNTKEHSCGKTVLRSVSITVKKRGERNENL